MKRVISVTSLALIPLLLWTLTARPAPASAAADARFAGLPEGVRTPVAFGTSDLLSLTGTPLERRNQLRDWLLYIVVSDAGLTEDGLSRVLFDVPPLRTGYTEPVAHFEYGAVRSRTIGPGEVVALVPREGENERIDSLAAVADQEFKTTGVRPSVVHVFEYELSDEGDRGWLTRLPDVTGDALFSSAFGYVELEVTNAADLTRFLDTANDVTSARFAGGRLLLGGRRIASRAFRGLRLEDVAALWQAETGPRTLQQEIDAFDRRWSGRTYRFDFEREALERERDAEFAALQKRLEEAMGGKAVDSTGFSLDPVFDYDALAEVFDAWSRPIAVALEEGVPGISYGPADIRAAIAHRDEGPLLETLYAMQQTDTRAALLAAVVQQELSDAQFQQARYDGRLQGTEVGMALFYTDLLAKLWAMDFAHSAPSADVEDFVPLLTIRDAAIFRREAEELSGTRLWFGPRDDGYHKVADGILLARTATRVYAASSNTLKPGEEAEPNAASAAFLGWWNNHYDAVAAAEPEYDRLNEIMKWGLIFGRMSDAEFESLSFLQPVEVTRTHWFPDWARRNPRLTFTAWSSVRFFPRGFLGTTTEALPLLTSREFEGRSYSGGVSLPSPRMLRQRPVLSESTDVLVRRSTVREELFADGKRVLKGFDDVAFEFQGGAADGARGISVTPRAASRLRGADVELRNSTFHYSVARRDTGFSFRIDHDAAAVGEFSVRRAGNGFQAAFHAHEMERARTLLRVVDDVVRRGEEPALAIARVPGVERVVPGTDGAIYVKLPGQPRWLKVGEEGAPSIAIPEGVDVRYAGFGADDAPRWTAGWVEEKAVGAEIGKGQFIRVRTDSGTLDGVIAQPLARGPPETAAAYEIAAPSGRVPAWRDADGWTWVRSDAAGDIWTVAHHAKGGAAANTVDAVRNLQHRLRAGDIEGAARALAAGEPARAAETIAAFRSASLDKADSLMTTGRWREAVEELETAARLFPADADINLRRALALVGNRRPESGMDLLAKTLRESPGDAVSRLERMAAVVPDSAMSNASTTVRAAELNGRLSDGAVRGSAALRPDRTGRVRMEVRLLEWQRVAASRPVEPGRPVYVEIGADYDPVIGVRQGVEQMISDAPAIHRLRSWEIVSAAPDTIVDAATGIRYARVGRVLSPPITGSLQPCPEDAWRLTTHCGEDVYLVDRASSPRAN